MISSFTPGPPFWRVFCFQNGRIDLFQNNNKPSLEAIREQWLKQLIADPKAKPSYFRVAWAIACHMNRERGGWAWPGFNRIAGTARVNRSTAIRACNWMESAGHLRIVRKRKSADRNDPNQYQPILRGGGSGNLPPSSGPQATQVVAPVPPEPLIEPINTAAVPCGTSDSNSEKNWELWERLLQAIGAVSDDPKWIGQYHWLIQWMMRGYDFDLDILPTVSRLHLAANQRGKAISSMKYFNQAIAEAQAERLAPPTPIAPRTNNGNRNPKRIRRSAFTTISQQRGNRRQRV